jgi:hypothetical protein
LAAAPRSVSQSIMHWYRPANPHFLKQRVPISSTKVKLDIEFIYGNIGGHLLDAIHLGSLQNTTLVEGDPISLTQVAVKFSEAAESYGVSNENFGGYNTLCPTQNMGPGKHSKRARHLAKC